MLTILADMLMTAAGHRKPDLFARRNSSAQWAGASRKFSLWGGW